MTIGQSQPRNLLQVTFFSFFKLTKEPSLVNTQPGPDRTAKSDLAMEFVLGFLANFVGFQIYLKEHILTGHTTRS